MTDALHVPVAGACSEGNQTAVNMTTLHKLQSGAPPPPALVAYTLDKKQRDGATGAGCVGAPVLWSVHHTPPSLTEWALRHSFCAQVLVDAVGMVLVVCPITIAMAHNDAQPSPHSKARRHQGDDATKTQGCRGSEIIIRTAVAPHLHAVIQSGQVYSTVYACKIHRKAPGCTAVTPQTTWHANVKESRRRVCAPTSF